MVIVDTCELLFSCMSRQVHLGVFVKIRDFIKFKGFLVEFLEQAILRKSKPPENRQKSGLF